MVPTVWNGEMSERFQHFLVKFTHWSVIARRTFSQPLPSLFHMSCQQPGYMWTVILQIKLFTKKKNRRSTAWRVQAITSPSAPTKGQNIRKEERCKRHKDSWLLRWASLWTSMCPVQWPELETRARAFLKSYTKPFAPVNIGTVCPCLSAQGDLINLSTTWNFCSACLDGRVYLATTERVRTY